MNLLLLPDEMVASVFKFTGYSTIKILRRTNVRCDNIANAYNVGIRLPTSIISFSSSTSSDDRPSESWKLEVKFCHKDALPTEKLRINLKFDREFDQNHGSHLDIIDRILKTVELRGTLELFNFCHGIDDQLLRVFENNRKSIRNLVQFKLRNTNVACSDSSVKKFISSVPKLRDYYIGFSDTSMNVFYQTAMLENRDWDAITLWNCKVPGRHVFEYPRLNDDFLKNVVKNCERCSINFSKARCTSFTVDGVIKLIETLVQEEKTPDRIDLGSVHCNKGWCLYVKNKLHQVNSKLLCKFFTTKEVYRNERTVIQHHCKVSFVSNPEIINVQFYQLEEYNNQDRNNE